MRRNKFWIAIAGVSCVAACSEPTAGGPAGPTAPAAPSAQAAGSDTCVAHAERMAEVAASFYVINEDARLESDDRLAAFETLRLMSEQIHNDMLASGCSGDLLIDPITVTATPRRTTPASGGGGDDPAVSAATREAAARGCDALMDHYVETEVDDFAIVAMSDAEVDDYVPFLFSVLQSYGLGAGYLGPFTDYEGFARASGCGAAYDALTARRDAVRADQRARRRAERAAAAAAERETDALIAMVRPLYPRFLTRRGITAFQDRGLIDDAVAERGPAAVRAELEALIDVWTAAERGDLQPARARFDRYRDDVALGFGVLWADVLARAVLADEPTFCAALASPVGIPSVSGLPWWTTLSEARGAVLEIGVAAEINTIGRPWRFDDNGTAFGPFLGFWAQGVGLTRCGAVLAPGADQTWTAHARLVPV